MAARTCLGCALRTIYRKPLFINANPFPLWTRNTAIAGGSEINMTGCTWARNFSTVQKIQTSKDRTGASGVVELVNEALQTDDVGRLFAIVYVAGKQRKITTEDIIVVEGDFHPNVGDRIRLEKVLLVGGSDFSLAGRPLLSRNLVKVEATVVEKTLSNFKVKFNYVRRKGHRRFNLNRSPQTMLVINNIELNQLNS